MINFMKRYEENRDKVERRLEQMTVGQLKTLDRGDFVKLALGEILNTYKEEEIETAIVWDTNNLTVIDPVKRPGDVVYIIKQYDVADMVGKMLVTYMTSGNVPSNDVYYNIRFKYNTKEPIIEEMLDVVYLLMKNLKLLYMGV